MDKNIGLSPLPKDGERLLSELNAHNMVVARSANDFLYIIEIDKAFHLFTHTPGMPGGGRKRLPFDEKNTAIIKNIANVSDSLFLVEFDKNLDLFGVMASAENAIISAFPGSDRDSDEDIEFVIPQV